MKQLKLYIIGLTTLLAVLLTQGCVLLLAGAAAGAAVGTVSYVGNELHVNCDTTVDRAWTAANAAMGAMEYTVIPAETHKDATGGTVSGRNAKDQRVVIQLLRKAETTIALSIRVGEFDTAANRAAAQLFYDKMKVRL